MIYRWSSLRPGPVPTVLLSHLQIVVVMEYKNMEHLLSYFAIPCCCYHMFGSNSVACCFSALFIIIAGFAAVATVCDQTWRSVDQTLSRCLTVCCRWPVALCLLRFEGKCVNNLSYRSVRIHIYWAVAPANAAHQYIFKLHMAHGWSKTHILWRPVIYSKLLINNNSIIHNVSIATCFNVSASYYTSVVLKL